MRKKYMKITVTGLPHSGKTVLAEFIGDVLAEHGFDVLMETDEEEYAEGQQEAAIKALADSGLRIVVQERDAKQRPAPKPKHKPADLFTGKDEVISCSSCENEFTFTVGEQRFFKDRGLSKAPRRCRSCRDKKRSKQNHADVAQR